MFCRQKLRLGYFFLLWNFRLLRNDNYLGINYIYTLIYYEKLYKHEEFTENKDTNLVQTNKTPLAAHRLMEKDTVAVLFDYFIKLKVKFLFSLREINTTYT